MTEWDALALVVTALRRVNATAADAVTPATDLVGDGLLDSLDVMAFLYELEQLLGSKIESIGDDYDDFRVSEIIRHVIAGAS